MLTSKASNANHYLLESELSPKVNIAMSTEELPGNGSFYDEVRMKLAYNKYYNCVSNHGQELVLDGN